MSKLSVNQRAEVIEHLLEGNGIRPTARLCEIDKKTVMGLLGSVGRGSIYLHNEHVVNVAATHIDADELHSFVKKRQRNVTAADSADVGEQWVWIALARTSKLLISYAVSKRSQDSANAFMLDLRSRLANSVQLCTDAYPGYPRAVGEAFCNPTLPAGGIDYAQIVKSFSGRKRDYDKVAPAQGMSHVTKRPIWGAPDMGEVGTSYAEREMLNLRTHLRRLVRRGIGHSKTLAGHVAAIATFVFWRNFCLPHGALNGKTPAQAAGLADHRWTTVEFVEAALGADEIAPPSPGPLAPRPGIRGAARQTSTGAWLRAVPLPGSAPATLPAPVPDLFTWAAANPEKVGPPHEDRRPVASEPPLPPIGAQLSFNWTERER
jgi:IS1 family transposase